MDLKLKKKISKMSLEELNKFLDIECETQEDRENLLSELVNNPYLELYKDNKELTNISLENGKKIKKNIIAKIGISTIINNGKNNYLFLAKKQFKELF